MQLDKKQRQLAGSFFNRHAITRLNLALTVCSQTVSGSISLGVSPSFSPFPHGTCSLSVTTTYLALEDGSPRFLHGMCRIVLGILLRVILVLYTRLSLSLASYSELFYYLNYSYIRVPQPPFIPKYKQV